LGNPRFLNLVGAKYIIIPSNQKIPENYFGEKISGNVLNFKGGQLINNGNAFPRAFLVKSYKKYDNIADIFKEIMSGKEDLSQSVLLEDDPDLSLPTDPNESDSAWIISHHTDSVNVGIYSTQNSILVLTDNYYDSWKAYVDNKPANILRAYGSFRAVAIPAGTRRVSFNYESKRYNTAKAVTWCTIFYLVIVFGSYSIKPLLKRRGKIGKSEQGA